MKLGEKIRYLREVEGSLRGLGRPMTQLELVRAMREELGKSRSEKGHAQKGGSNQQKTISQSYLSQIENGARPHMTQSSRALLAKFFKVHPGFLVDDPDGYHAELDFGSAHDRRPARCLAVARFGAFRERPGSEPRADQGSARERYAAGIAAVGRDS